MVVKVERQRRDQLAEAGATARALGLARGLARRRRRAGRGRGGGHRVADLFDQPLALLVGFVLLLLLLLRLGLRLCGILRLHLRGRILLIGFGAVLLWRFL